MKKRKSRALTALAVLVVLAAIVAAAMKLGLFERKNTVRDEPVPDWVDVQLIDIDGASRRGVKLEEINDIVVHYVGNPGTTAQQNRNYFNNPDSEVSSHFVIGLDGEVIQCVPLDEKSSATSERNRDTISIEVCHPDETGAFSPAAYQQVVELTAWLCRTFRLDPETEVIRHYDVTGKVCPRYYVENPDAWDAFRADVAAEMEVQEAAEEAG